MDSLALLATVLGAAAAGLIGYSLVGASVTERARVAFRVSRTGIGLRQSGTGAADLRLRARSQAVFAPVDHALSSYSWAERARRELELAEINLHVSEFVAIRVVASVLAFALVLLAAGTAFLAVMGALGASLVVWFLVGGYVRRRINRRKQQIEAQLDGVLIHITGSLRAGFSFLQACQMSVNQMAWPLKQEFTAMLEDVNVGASLDDALRSLAQRLESYEVDIAVNAVLVQRQVGGSLAEILENVAHTIRERRELRGHIMALTAQQRLSSYFVAAVPVFMAALLSLISWQFIKPLYLTFTGNILLSIGIVLDVLGFLLMRRLTRIDF